MKYLGGKSRIAKELASVISPGGYWWDPFCGGLSVSCALADYGRGLISDINLPLISLYKSVANGWQPPVSLSREEWELAKLLPDHDPLKAFAGIGCSVQGLWFDTYYGPVNYAPTRTHPKGKRENPVAQARNTLIRDLFKLTACRCCICHLDFFSVTPRPGLFDSIYLDPPYKNTRAYGYIGVFDHNLFWKHAVEWSKVSRVFVSELSCPVKHDLVWSKDCPKMLGTKGQKNGIRQEKLFRLL